MKLEPSAYRALEIEKILSLASRHCRSELGAAALAEMTPATDLPSVHRRQALFCAVKDYRDKRGELPWHPKLAPVGVLLREAAKTGLLIGQELLKIAHLLGVAARTRTVLQALGDDDGRAAFVPLLARLRDFSEELDALGVLDDDGRLYDQASPKLREIRTRTRALRDTLSRKAQALLAQPRIVSLLQERVLSLRERRYAFLVKNDAMAQFPGILVDRSGSGNSVYMEPHALIPLNNEHRLLLEEESVEETRILQELTDRMLARAKAIHDAEGALGTLDLFYSLEEVTRLEKWHLPQISAEKKFSLKGARHPLLGERAVPIDLALQSGARILVVTGPNTGGKTVALKTAAVCFFLGWMGFPIPCAEGTQLCDIDTLYADIGDEQSIEQNLSTFSAHVKHIVQIVKEAGDRSLVLLDELGAGTDPEEGAALGIAILEHLLAQKSWVLATTHHNPIKRFALQTPHVESASVEFDPVTLSSTYRLLIGVPGRSNALMIAQKLGMPPEICRRAKEALGREEASMEELIGELYEKQTALDRRAREVDALRGRTEKTLEHYERQKEQLDERTERLLADADRKAAAIVRNAEDAARAMLQKMETSAESAAAARKQLDEKRRHFARLEDQARSREEKRVDRLLKKSPNAQPERPLAAGDTVEVVGSNVKGTLQEISGKKATLLSGAVRLEVPAKKLRRVNDPNAGAPAKPSVSIKVGTPQGVPSSIMIRGMTIDEAVPIVEQYLDNAYLAGYGEVAVIHGRGEGILRREVTGLCKRLPYVESHRLGGAGEGGYGVTIVRFKR